MMINITADVVVWIIAVMLVLLFFVLLLILFAIRIAAGLISKELEGLKKKVPNLGGGGNGGGGGLGDILGGIGNMFGGGK